MLDKVKFNNYIIRRHSRYAIKQIYFFFFFFFILKEIIQLGE